MPTNPADITLTSTLARQARLRPDALAFADASRSITYDRLADIARKIADRLAECGVTPGDRVLYIGKNSLEYFELLCGCAEAGAVMVPASWRLTRPELDDLIADARPALIFVDQDTPYADGPTVPVATGTPASGLEPWLGPLKGDERALRDGHPDDVIVHLYTSGTTGKPKGVMLTNRNLLGQRSANEGVVPWDDWSDNDVSLVSMPIAHISGTGWAMYHLHAGACGIVVPMFDADEVVGLIGQRRITRMFIVPAALDLLAAAATRTSPDFGSLRTICYGGAPISLQSLERAQNVFSCDLVQLYGMTETAGAITALDPDDHCAAHPKRLASAGKPLPGVQLRIQPLAEGAEAGEVLVRGQSVMVGYFEQPSATHDALDADGWLHTGDVGTIDIDGYLYLHDRLKDMIITGGENVFATEVEAVISSHPAVAELAVIGVPDARWGEIVKAVVVVRNGEVVDQEALQDWARKRLASHKVPRLVSFVSALPRNPTGKILKKILRQQAAEAG